MSNEFQRFLHTSITSSAVSEVAPAPIFCPFDRKVDDAPRHGMTVPADRVEGHATDVRDLAAGIKTILQMLEFEYVNDEADRLDDEPERSPPMLSNFHRGQLLRMTIACAGVLERQAFDLCQDVDAKARARALRATARRANGRNPQA